MKNNGTVCFLGDPSVLPPHTFPSWGYSRVLECLKLSLGVVYVEHLSPSPVTIPEPQFFLFLLRDFRTAKGVIQRSQLTTFLFVCVSKDYPCNQLTNPWPDLMARKCQVAQNESCIFKRRPCSCKFGGWMGQVGAFLFASLK